MLSEVLVYNYKKALNKKYNAVCFDIDGTLTVSGSKQIDGRAIGMIAELLKKRIPIVFITGRGETGLADLINDLYNQLIYEHDLSYDDLKRMYALTNDGARMFYSTNNTNKLLFNNEIYIAKQHELEQVKNFDKVINDFFEKNGDKDCFDINYSYDFFSRTMLNVRFVFKTKDENQIENVVNSVKEIINSYNLNELVISRANYMDQEILQIGTTKKERAIEEVERIIGVPKNSMIRIGDRGDLMGNDYSMLNCKQGFSVNKTSGESNSCFPVLDENYNILKGVEATLHIVKSANLLPTVCLERAEKRDYIYNYAKVERDILRGRNKLLSVYNEIVNRNFDIVNGINDLFDHESGSVIIPMYEWELIDRDNPLFQLWSKENCDNLLYSLRDNNNYLLRGSSTYYYFLANRKSENGTDFTSMEDVISWYENNLTFIGKAFEAMHFNFDLSSVTNKKMILGILDNIRNILLVVINHNIVSKYYSNNLLMKLDSEDNKYFKQLYDVLYYNDSLMKKVCFDNYKFDYSDVLNILELLNSVHNLISYDFSKFRCDIKDMDYSKEFRTYREIDNFAENYIATKLNDEKIGRESDFSVCGMCYGGLELPVIYKIVNPDVDDVLLLKFNKDVSGYANKQLVDLREFDINKFGGLLKVGDFNAKNIVLMDDNVLTGKTIQLATNCLYDGVFTCSFSHISLVF